MLGRLSNELREIVWLAWVTGSLTIAGAGVAIVAVLAFEHLA
jgi:hypothetical protein